MVKQFICWFAFINWTPEAVTAAGTIALAFLTLVLAVGTLFLWFATRRLVKGSEKTAERQLRAYMNNVSTIIRNVEVGKVPEVRVEIKNWGHTPAYRVRHTGSYTLAIFPWSGTVRPPSYRSESTVGPGSNAFMLLKGHTLAAEHVAGLNDGSLAIYIEGSIIYNDAFDHDRFTNYRFWVGGDRGFPPDQAMFTDIRGNDAN